MKHPFLLCAVFLCPAGCATHVSQVNDHWTTRSIGTSLSRAFLSYDAESDGNYRDFAWRKKQSINLTLRRHLFNHNPENPFEPQDFSIYEKRPPNSLVPRPWDYIHVEGLVLGAIVYAGGGVFIPLPIDSIIGTFSEGGDKEFVEGVGETVRPIGVATSSFMHDALGLPETAGHTWAE